MQRLLLVLTAFAFGSVSLLGAQSWSAWKPDPVFHGIQIREHCGGFNEFANRYVWDVQLRNTYQKDVDLSWRPSPHYCTERRRRRIMRWPSNRAK